MRLIDLSHTIVDGQTTYPGLPPPSVGTHLGHEASRSQYTNGAQFHIGKIRMVTNSGTYVDSPFHRYPGEPDVAGLPLERLANLEAVCVASDAGCIGPQAFAGVDLAAKAVLVRTGWSRHWGSPAYFSGHPYLSAEAASLLADSGVAHVGIDSLNIDSTADGSRPVHSRLLAAGVPITEHLTNLAALPAACFRFFAVPVKVRGVGSFPVRAFALLP